MAKESDGEEKLFVFFTLQATTAEKERSVRVKDVLRYDCDSPPMRAHSRNARRCEKETLRKK